MIYLYLKEEMSNRFELYLSKIDEKVKETISERLNIAMRWVIA